MAEPWEAASRMMKGYFSKNRGAWPVFGASDLIGRIKLGADCRWTDRGLVGEAKQVLSQAFFDVDDLAENFLGLRLDISDLRSLDKDQGCSVFGRAYPKRKALVICERTLAYEPLYRATVVHEIGHVILHGNRNTPFASYRPALPASSPEEREANQFMQVALLPTSIFHLAVAYACDLWGADLRVALGQANGPRGRWLWRHRLFAPIMNLLCVSREMLCVKMAKLRLLSQETVEYHKTYALRTRWRQPDLVKPFRRVLETVITDLNLAASPPGCRANAAPFRRRASVLDGIWRKQVDHGGRPSVVSVAVR